MRPDPYEKIRAAMDAAQDYEPNAKEPVGPKPNGHDGAAARRLRAVSARELLAMDIPPREMVLAPVLPQKGLVMLYSKRGVGKTHIALGVGYAVASGGRFLRFQAPQPRKVLLIDGEMPLVALQERLALVVEGAEAEPPGPDDLKIIAADYQPDGIPDLTTPEGQAAVEEHMADGVELLILDNISTLCRSGKENEADSWSSVQEWALRLRRRGISILFIHHAGKGGAQRGTSRREDVLDTIINLRHPDDYDPREGARFEVHLEKARGVLGDDAKPFEARLVIENGAALWTTNDLENVELGRAARLFSDGLTVREVAREMEISDTKAGRLRQKAVQEGLFDG